MFAGKSYSQALLTQQEFLTLEETFHLLCSKSVLQVLAHSVRGSKEPVASVLANMLRRRYIFVSCSDKVGH